MYVAFALLISASYASGVVDSGVIDFESEVSMSANLRRLLSVTRNKVNLNPFPAYLSNYDSFNQSINENMNQVGYTLLVNLIVILVFWLIFSYKRMHDANLFAPKALLKGERTPPALSNKNLYSWMRELWNITDADILKYGGFDTLTFIRFYRLNYKIFGVFAIFAMLVLLPVNGSALAPDIDSFQRWSMTNIKEKSLRCWYHLVGICLLTGITIYYLEQEFLFYARHRHRYLRQRHAHLRTVLVEGIPHKMRSNKTLAMYFEVMYPNAVQNVRLAQDLRKLELTVADRLRALRLLETYLHEYHQARLAAGENVSENVEEALQGSRHPSEVPRPVMQIGDDRVDAIRHYARLVSSFNEVVAKEQAKSTDIARTLDSMTRAESMRVIEGLLRVTEVGKLGRLMSERRTERAAGSGERLSDSDEGPPGGAASVELPGGAMKQQSDGGDVAESVGYGGTGTTKSAARSAGDEALSELLGVDEEDVDGFRRYREEYGDDSASEELSYAGNDASPDKITYVRISYTQWFGLVWAAESFRAKMDRLFDGPVKRIEEGYGDDDNESTGLIQPLVERNMFLPKAFVTFKTFTAATVARQVIHMQLAGHMAVTEAPEPRDVTWENLYLSRKGAVIRNFFVEFFVVFLIVFWVVPVTLLSHVTALTFLQKVPWIKYACDSAPLLRSLLSLLQPAIIVGVMQVLPPLFHWLGEIQGCVSFSSNQFIGFDRYFLFQVINVFLVTTVAGSVADAVATVLTSPTNAFTLLGNSLPKMGGYFTTFIFIKAAWGLGMEMIRLPAMFQSLGKTLLYKNFTLREKTEAYWNDPHFGCLRFMDNPGSLRLAKLYAQDVLITVLCATFANVAPLLLVAGIAYFTTASLVYTHQFLYVYINEYETGGRWWPKIAKCMVVALLFGQGTMVGMMILKRTYMQIYFLAVLIALTVFYLWRIKYYYFPLGKHLPFDMATSMDMGEGEGEGGGMDLQGEEQYMQPELRPERATAAAMTDFYVAQEDSGIRRPDALPTAI